MAEAYQTGQVVLLKGVVEDARDPGNLVVRIGTRHVRLPQWEVAEHGWAWDEVIVTPLAVAEEPPDDGSPPPSD